MDQRNKFEFQILDRAEAKNGVKLNKKKYGNVKRYEA